MATDAFHERLLTIVNKLPETVEDWPWGSIHCKVADKIFVGWSRDDNGVMSIGIRTTLELQAMLVGSDPRFSIAKYVGKYGGIDMRLDPDPDWDEVEEFIVDSYRIVAPKRLVRLLDYNDAVAVGVVANRRFRSGRPRKDTRQTRLLEGPTLVGFWGPPATSDRAWNATKRDVSRSFY